MNSESKDFVANYELNDYRYQEFWKGRQYEHESEVLLLKKLLKKHIPDLADRQIMDLGGAYGRLSFLYEKDAKGVILADYSTSELKEGIKRISALPEQKKFSFVALNAYKLPYKNNSLQALLSVRVMHHLKNIELFWEELARTLSPGGVAIIEFANKNHILALVRHAFKFKLLQYLKVNTIQVGHQQTSQGMKEGQVSIMYNFSPSYIAKLTQKVGLELEGRYSCSFFRHQVFKKYLPHTLLLSLEKIAQSLFGWTQITPSVFFVVRKPLSLTDVHKNEGLVLHESLCCPLCYAEVSRKPTGYVCTNGHEFSSTEEIIVDLRDPRPSEITF